MTYRILRFRALTVAGTALFVFSAISTATPLVWGQSVHSVPSAPVASGPQSPFAGDVVEEIVVRVNDQIVTKSDYDRALSEMEAQGRQANATAQEIEEQKKNLLRDLVDQQLLLSKGKELGITGETELVKQLDTIRKQNHLESMEDLENAAKQQGVSFEDFKQHIRDRIITQKVIGQEVYRRVNISQADLQKYYEAHKAEFTRPESVRLNEILIATAPAVAAAGTTAPAEDPASVAAAQAKADEVMGKLKAGAKFEELAKTYSTGPNAASGGDLGEFRRGQLAKVLEDQTFALKAGQYTQPIQTKQGLVILYVSQHEEGGLAPLKDVLPQVEEAVGTQRTEPALRAYLKQLRNEAYIDYKPGYVDTAAVVNPSKPVYSAYNPPGPKKKRKVERTRFRQRAHGAAPKTQTATAPASVPSLAQVPGAATATGPGGVAAASDGSAPAGDQTAVASTGKADKKNKQIASNLSQKPGKKEKIRYGQAPRATLPSVGETRTVDAGAGTDTPAAGGETQVASNANGDVPPTPGPENVVPEKKTRFSARALLPKEKKSKAPVVDPFAPQQVTSDEVADRQTQSAPLGLAGDTSKKPKAPKPTEKTRLHDKAKEKETPAGDAAPASAPAATPADGAAPPK